MYAGGHPAEMQLCGKGPGGSGGDQAEDKPVVCPCRQQGRQYSGVH